MQNILKEQQVLKTHRIDTTAPHGKAHLDGSIIDFFICEPCIRTHLLYILDSWSYNKGCIEWKHIEEVVTFWRLPSIGLLGFLLAESLPLEA